MAKRKAKKKAEYAERPKGKQSPPADAVLAELRASQAWQRDLRDDQLKFHYQLDSARRKTHDSLLLRIAKQAGVDIEPLAEDARRRHEVENRRVEKFHDRTVRRITRQVGRERRRRQREYKLYLRAIKDDLQKVFHNPVYEMKIPDIWYAEDTSPPGPAYGSGFPVHIPEVEARPDFVYETIPGRHPDVPVTMNPFCRVDIGPDLPGRRIASTQHFLVYMHSPPAEDHLIDEISVMISLFGYSASFGGDATIFVSQLLPEHSNVYARVSVAIHYSQVYTPSRRSYTMHYDLEELLWSSRIGHPYAFESGSLYAGEPIMKTRELNISPPGLTLLSDRIGRHFYITVEVNCTVSAEDKNQSVHLSFAPPDLGIQVHHVIVRTTPID